MTVQRLILHRVVRERGGHASAEEVLAAASERLPQLSLPTVYATLELFEELGVVRRVALGPGPVRFDPRIDDHHHLACRRCGQVVDLEVAVDAGPALAAACAAGLQAERAEVVVRGLCRDGAPA